VTDGAHPNGQLSEARTIRAVRIRILPFIFLLYVVAFLDRINIGFAALTMNRELAITSRQFGLIVGVFFLGYFLFEIPSNLILHRIGARVWIARILISWGVVAAATGFVRSVPQLLAARFLLGLAEAGFFPGMVLYLTYWFRQREQARAIALFMTAQPLTSILGAPLSGLILDHIHWLGMSSWRWLLVLEGVPAIACGILAYFLLPSRPADATFLTAGEKQWLDVELRREDGRKLESHPISPAQALVNGRVWLLACIGFTQAIGAYSLTFWLPQEVKSFSGHYSNTVVGLLVAIPYLVGLLSMILVSRSSDRRQERRFHAAIPLAIGGLGFVSLGVVHSPVASIALLSCAAFGVYSFFGPYFASPSEFSGRVRRRIGHCLDHIGRESWRLRRPVRGRPDQSACGKSLQRPRHSRRLAVRVSDPVSAASTRQSRSGARRRLIDLRRRVCG
jgi:ACS family tartrate transporter-like MFS transporter